MLLRFVQTHYFYLLLLIVSIGGLLFADWRFKLVFWQNATANAKAIGSVMLLLLIFDIAGITSNIFSTNSRFVVGLYFVTPHLPLEELFFLFLLCFSTLMTYQIILRVTKNA